MTSRERQRDESFVGHTERLRHKDEVDGTIVAMYRELRHLRPVYRAALVSLCPELEPYFDEVDAKSPLSD
jgi:hypothetical protein